MAGEEDQHDLGLSLGGLYQGNSGGARMARAVSVGVDVTEVAAAPRPRAVSLPSVSELEMMRVSEVQFLSRAMAASLSLTIQEEKAKKAPAEAVRLPEVAALGVNVTGSGRLAATSSTVSSELMSGEGSSNQPVVTTSMMANTKKVKADDPEQDSAAKRARVYHRNVVRPIRREGMVRMPSVTTTGADGKKVEGYLYKYLGGKVRIVCACHGTFQSPAEFVKHAGGNEVANPLKQITVSLY
ncbi:ninja-family protein 3-like [Rosa rugosa]|uniref:ninja-family protein 3-like n=1 Tax=Rosa rugosa TaxID=74645 RepID=UPI002B40FDF7|nr:ninja-family protein 3-like [Rosa rugosa]